MNTAGDFGGRACAKSKGGRPGRKGPGCRGDSRRRQPHAGRRRPQAGVLGQWRESQQPERSFRRWRTGSSCTAGCRYCPRVDQELAGEADRLSEQQVAIGPWLAAVCIVSAEAKRTRAAGTVEAVSRRLCSGVGTKPQGAGYTGISLTPILLRGSLHFTTAVREQIGLRHYVRNFEQCQAI